MDIRKGLLQNSDCNFSIQQAYDKEEEAYIPVLKIQLVFIKLVEEERNFVALIHLREQRQIPMIAFNV